MAQDRTSSNVVNSDVTEVVRPRRIQVLNGAVRHREWPTETKIAIVAEAIEPGVVVSHVARRHDIAPSQLFAWIKQFRNDAVRRAATPDFAPALLDIAAVTPIAMAASAEPTAIEPASIEIVIGAATVRIRGAADAKTLSVVLKALRALA